MIRPLLVLVALVAALAPASAQATQPGPNGKIVFTSGRTDGAALINDSNAQLWIVDAPGGTPRRITDNLTIQHRHPSWSPDRTKMVYAAGASGNFDLYVLDVTKPLASGANPVNITNTVGLAEDRPSWSPDGASIAYANGPPPTSANDRDLEIRNPDGSGKRDVATNATKDEDRPTWTPDSRTLFYHFDNAANSAIYRRPANTATPLADGTLVFDTPAKADIQAALSADGSKLCWTIGVFGSGDTDVVVLPSTGAGTPVDISDNVGVAGVDGDYNCTWSPDGTKVAFVAGTFTDAALVMANADGAGGVTSVVNDVPGVFDGNPDWAPNPPPTCQNATVDVAFNSFVVIPLRCTDPAPESLGADEQIATPPGNGVLGAVTGGTPATVIYTPKVNFQGTDTFTFTGSDNASTSAPATITVRVAGPPAPPPPPPPPPPDDETAPVISSFRVSPTKWRHGTALPTFAAARTGTTISFRINENARVTLAFSRAVTGRRVGTRCVARTRSNRRRRACTRFVGAGALSRSVRAGARRVRFQGRITRTRRLGLGRHRVTITAVDAADNESRSRTASFRIVAR